MEMLCLEVINSDWHDHRGLVPDEDRLLQPAWLERLLACWQLAVATKPAASEIAALQALRTLMQQIVQNLMDRRTPTAAQMEALNRYLAAAPFHRALREIEGQYQLQDSALQQDWNWVLGEVASSFATLITRYDTSRIKRCENPQCRWTYYDESANHTRRWCEDSCANLMRVRRFRTRQQVKK
ncbi:CGNR zinc finger domain-containing protein [Dictyobacter kobayashii]|uniref:Zinc finger CGNR domain-containing protein n=1 Tax=Dictyobacter kobayashii TaxID=2014872 RepID=A0A402AYW6_9CHLR|nr:CGNR zinc finger domain-containing protein [Dictyobacter kobayashii]GCE24273.1 hypothetical protein KDK_80730 [Dictyobacter kobayashii]